MMITTEHQEVVDLPRTSVNSIETLTEQLPEQESDAELLIDVVLIEPHKEYLRNMNSTKLTSKIRKIRKSIRRIFGLNK